VIDALSLLIIQQLDKILFLPRFYWLKEDFYFVRVI